MSGSREEGRVAGHADPHGTAVGSSGSGGRGAPLVVRILVADDHGTVRRGVAGLVASVPGWEVCAAAANGLEAVEAAARHRPDVAIVDAAMPRLNGIDATRRILEVSPATRVLVLTAHHSENLVGDALEAGASGFVLKEAADREVVEAVNEILAGRRFFGHRFPAGAAGEATARRGSRTRLTPREREVVQLIAEGRSTKEVAATLGISIKTADAHRTNAMRKLDVHSVTDLVRYAVRNFLVEP